MKIKYYNMLKDEGSFGLCIVYGGKELLICLGPWGWIITGDD